MRIRTITIEQFGIFSGHEIEFPGDSLQIVYGPNEAGKSTLLQLIRELLFGFAVRNPYAFADHAAEMAATATLEMADGAQVRFRRRKGRRNEVVGEFLEKGCLENGRAIDAVALNRLLGNASVELFQNVFGFSLEELADGQKSLEHAKLSEALYGGALGGLAGFQNVLEGLGKEHEALFSPSATKKPINRLLSQLRKQAKEMRAAAVRPRDYGQLEKEFDELRAGSLRLQQEREDLQRQQQQNEQLTKALKLWHERTLQLNELADLDVPSEFPPDGQQQFERHRKRRDEVAAELDNLRQELSAMNAELDILSPRMELLGRSADIQRLTQQLDNIRGFRRDMVLRQQESQTVKSDVLAKLRELDPEWTLEHLQQFQVSVARSESVAAMQQELDDLHLQQRDQQIKRRSLEDDIAELSRRLEELSDDDATSPLTDLVELAAEYATRIEKLEGYQQDYREQQSQRAALQQKLVAPFDNQLEDLVPLPVPLAETIVEYQQRYDELNRDLERAESEARRDQDELEQRRRELAALQTEEQVPDRSQLHDARDHRDCGWKLVRRKYIEGESVADREIERWAGEPPVPLPKAYAESVQYADQIADRRQQQAEVVAQLDQLAQTIGALQRRCDLSGQAHATCAANLETWRRQWYELWEPADLVPQSPKAMLDWITLHGELVDTVAQMGTLQGHQDVQQEWIEHYLTRLSTALNDTSGTPTEQISEAVRRVQLARDAAAERKTYAAELPFKKRQLATVDQDLEELDQQLEQWQSRWRPLMEEFGFPTSWNVHIATKVLGGLRDARMRQEKADSLDARIHEMREGIERFEHDVAALCTAIAPQLNERPPENAVEELAELLSQTRTDAAKKKTLLAQLESTQAKYVAKQEQETKEQAAIDDLIKLAGVQREEELPELARRVTDWHQKQAALDRVEQQLRYIRGEEDRSVFDAALEVADEAQLESRQQILRTNLERVEQQFNEALQAQGVAAQKLKDLDQASLAAAAAQDIESTRSELAETVDRWAPRVLARAFMVRAMEQFQREHQPHMLVDVARLLRRMTLGRYTEISRKLDQQGSLQVHQGDGVVKEPHQLSTGTRQQLYLAIRLAYVLHYCREAEPLPIVMDDVLVNFDDRRAAETIGALAEISQNAQLILLTCHQQTVDLVRAHLPDLKPITLGD